jgi:hypothetical protein
MFSIGRPPRVIADDGKSGRELQAHLYAALALTHSVSWTAIGLHKGIPRAAACLHSYADDGNATSELNVCHLFPSSA